MIERELKEILQKYASSFKHCYVNDTDFQQCVGDVIAQNEIIQKEIQAVIAKGFFQEKYVTKNNCLKEKKPINPNGLMQLEFVGNNECSEEWVGVPLGIMLHEPVSGKASTDSIYERFNKSKDETKPIYNKAKKYYAEMFGIKEEEVEGDVEKRKKSYKDDYKKSSKEYECIKAYLRAADKYNSSIITPHFAINGDTGQIVNLAPCTIRTNHCGGTKKRTFNDTHIAIEICEPSGVVPNKAGEEKIKKMSEDELEEKRIACGISYRSAVRLCALLCIKFSIDPMLEKQSDKTKNKQYCSIISHREGCVNFGRASNHGDPEALWKALWPKGGAPYTMDNFRLAVKEQMEKFKKEGISEKLILPPT